MANVIIEIYFRITSMKVKHVANCPSSIAQVPRVPLSSVTKSNIEM